MGMDSARGPERAGLGLSPLWLLDQETGWLISNRNSSLPILGLQIQDWDQAASVVG